MLEQIYNLDAEHQPGRSIRENLSFEVSTRQEKGMQKLIATTLHNDNTDDTKQVFAVSVSYEAKVSWNPLPL